MNSPKIDLLAIFINLAKHTNSAQYQRLPIDVVSQMVGDLVGQYRYEISQTQQNAYVEILNRIKLYTLPPLTSSYRAAIGVNTTIPDFPTYNIPGFTEEVQTAELSASGRQPLDKNRMTPHGRFVTEGRANAVGIPVLYCATDIKTALLECRSPAGSAVTVATVTNPKELKLADLRLQPQNNLWQTESEFWDRVTEEVAVRYSKRVVGSHAWRDYVLTQHFAELIRRNDFDGIIYSSSQSVGDNLAIFETSDVNISSTQMFEVTAVDLNYSPLPVTAVVSQNP